MTISVFLSHSVDDVNILVEIKKEFEDKDVDLYIAEEDIQPGSVLVNKIKQAIDKCDIFLVLITKKGSRSNWVNSEIGMAIHAKKRIVPMLEKGVDVPSPIIGLERIEFKIDDTDGAVKSLREFLMKFKNSKDNSAVVDIMKGIEIVLFVILGVILLSAIFSKK